MSHSKVAATSTATQASRAASYKDYVKVMCMCNPSLLTLYDFLSRGQALHHRGRFVALDFREKGRHPIFRRLKHIDALSRELHDQAGAHEQDGWNIVEHPLQGRLLIIEDLTVDVIELLGSTLDIDPLFFAMHLHTLHRTGRCTPTSDEATLPSRFEGKDFMSIAYHRPVTRGRESITSNKLVRAMAVDRKLVFLQSEPIGLVQHRASIIKLKTKVGGWLALLLADPPLTEKYFVSGHKDDPSSQMSIHVMPYLGPYENFAELPNFSEEWKAPRTVSSGGMLDDTIHYWEQMVPSWFNREDPTIASLAYYPLRIVAAEWVKYTEVMHNCIKRFEYQGDQLPSLSGFNADLQELQSWRRRTLRSQEKCNAIIRRLKACTSSVADHQSAMQALVTDYETIAENIRVAGRTLENMLPVVTSLVQIIDARQSFAETANISRLTVLALTFVPLSFVASLFSMNSSNMPGSAHFWVYLVVAIPLTVFVFLVARPPDALQHRVIPWALQCLRRRTNFKSDA